MISRLNRANATALIPQPLGTQGLSFHWSPAHICYLLSEEKHLRKDEIIKARKESTMPPSGDTQRSECSENIGQKHTLEVSLGQ